MRAFRVIIDGVTYIVRVGPAGPSGCSIVFALLILLLCGSLFYLGVIVPFEWARFGIKPGVIYTDAERKAIKAYQRSSAQQSNEERFNDTDWVTWINKAQEREIARILMDPKKLRYQHKNSDTGKTEYVQSQSGVIMVTKVFPVRVIDADFRIRRVLLEGRVVTSAYCYTLEGVGECVGSPTSGNGRWRFDGWEFPNAKIHIVTSGGAIESCTVWYKGENDSDCVSVSVIYSEHNSSWWGDESPHRFEIKSVLYPRYSKKDQPKATPTRSLPPTHTPTQPIPTTTRRPTHTPSGSTNSSGGKQTPAIKATSSPATNCANPFAQITSPPMDSVIKNVLEIRGTAIRENFDFYKFEYQREGSTEWSWLSTNNQPVQNGVLLQLDLNQLQVPAGVYWLRLIVVDEAGNYWPEPCQLRIHIEN